MKPYEFNLYDLSYLKGFFSWKHSVTNFALDTTRWTCSFQNQMWDMISPGPTSLSGILVWIPRILSLLIFVSTMYKSGGLRPNSTRGCSPIRGRWRWETCDGAGEDIRLRSGWQIGQRWPRRLQGSVETHIESLILQSTLFTVLNVASTLNVLVAVQRPVVELKPELNAHAEGAVLAPKHLIGSLSSTKCGPVQWVHATLVNFHFTLVNC